MVHMIKLLLLVPLWCVSVFLSIGCEVSPVFDMIQAYAFPFYFISLFLVCLLLLLVLVFHIIVDRRVYMLKGFVVAVVFFATHGIATYTIIQFQKGQSFEQANQITDALDKYHTQTGKYPVNLKQLEPEYLTEVPATMMGWNGTPFYYRVFKYDRYELFFDCPLTMTGKFKYKNYTGIWRFYRITGIW